MRIYTELPQFTFEEVHDVIVHEIDGIILPMSKSTDRVIMETIITKQGKRIMVVEVHFVSILSMMERSSKKYTITIEEGKMEVFSVDIEPAWWMQYIRGGHDFHKNPTNIPVWDKLPQQKIKYEGKKLFITDIEMPYIKTEMGWILSDLRWLSTTDQIAPDIKEEVDFYNHMLKSIF